MKSFVAGKTVIMSSSLNLIPFQSGIGVGNDQIATSAFIGDLAGCCLMLPLPVENKLSASPYVPNANTSTLLGGIMFHLTHIFFYCETSAGSIEFR